MRPIHHHREVDWQADVEEIKPGHCAVLDLIPGRENASLLLLQAIHCVLEDEDTGSVSILTELPIGGRELFAGAVQLLFVVSQLLRTALSTVTLLAAVALGLPG